ncbi:MAG: NAD(P)/FAD-dependent oxidoreductase [Gammaproteobacteria bacterium]
MSQEPKNIDALIIGAGPCGLFQAFELGLLGINSIIIDSMDKVGGQCSELYPDKPIYDIPGIPICSAQELIDNLLKQIEPFNPKIQLGEEVVGVEKIKNGYLVTTSKEIQFITKTIFIAGGVGSFQAKKLRLDTISDHEDQWLYYKIQDKNKLLGKNIVIFGGGDSALDWAIEFATDKDFVDDPGSQVSLVHRRDEYRGAPASVNTIKELANQKLVTLYETSTLRSFKTDNNHLKSLTLYRDGKELEIEADVVLVFFGLSPKLGPIADWGLEINKKSIEVNTESFETNHPGIFAIGDIANYPGKKKLILSGFHEAALAAFAAKAIIEPGKKVHLQYTTTSPKLQERLGVSKK